jgi:hypothetical protein
VTALDDLRAIAPPPPDPPASTEAGHPLPADYEQLAREYGPGAFAGFLWLLAPGAANQYLDLDKQAEVRLDALRTLGEELPYEPLLPFAFTDNGDVVYWHQRTPDPDTWTVAVNESRGPEWHAFDGTATEFLAASLSGRERVPMFPEDFPGPDPSFAPAPAT